MQGDTRPCANLVPQNERRQKGLAVVQPFGFEQSQSGRQHAATRMPLGQLMTVMAIKRINGHPPGKGSARRTDGASIE